MAKRSQQLAPIVLLGGLILAGCTESVRVRANPGAIIYANGAEIGATETIYRVPSLNVPKSVGFEAKSPDGTTQYEAAFAQHSRGRVAGMVFTLGILRLFRTSATLPDRVDMRTVAATDASDREQRCRHDCESERFTCLAGTKDETVARSSLPSAADCAAIRSRSPRLHGA